MASFTAAGAGTEGFPRLKSKTFSAPYSWAICRPSSNMARITELFRARRCIFSEIMALLAFSPCCLFGQDWVLRPHWRDSSTAVCQRPSSLSRLSSVIWGKNTRSVCWSRDSSSVPLQTPVASPAK